MSFAIDVVINSSADRSQKIRFVCLISVKKYVYNVQHGNHCCEASRSASLL